MNSRILKRIERCALVALAISAGSWAAHADSYYSSQAAWAAALSASPTTINFEGIGAPFIGTTSIVGEGPGTSVTVGGVTFGIGPTGLKDFLVIGGDNSYYPAANLSAQPTNGVTPADLLITLPNSVTGLAFDFGSLYVQNTVTITLSDGSIETLTAPASTDTAFFGVIAPGGIDSVDLTLPNSGTTYGMAVTDFSYGTAGTSVTPEPSSLLLLGSGLIGFAKMVRRKLGVRA